MKKIGVLFFLILLVGMVWGQNTFHVYINEIRADDEGGDDINFVELIGPAGTNITGFVIRHYNQASTSQFSKTISSFSFPDDGITDTEGNSLGFFILSQTSSVANYDQIESFDPQTGPGDYLVLFDDSNNVLDAVAWGTPTTGFESIGLTQSGLTTANNYLHVTINDTDFDVSLQAPDNVLGDDGSGWIRNTATPGGINIGQTSGDIVLPVTLSSFTAFYSKNAAVLNWITQSETDNLGFNLYRSENEHGYPNGAYLSLNSTLIEGMGTTSTPTYYSFTDEYPVIEGHTYWYWLQSVSTTNKLELFGPVSLEIPVAGQLPTMTILSSNYPNPFNPETTIEFNVKENETGILTIFNLRGERILKESFEAGNHQYHWNAEGLASGIYFYKLSSPTTNISKKMILMK